MQRLRVARFFNQLGADHILDFSTADGNSIDILASAFAGGPVAGNDATGIFGSSANNTFGSGTERFHFNTATHTLLYNSNGSTAGGTQVALAVLENGGTVDARIFIWSNAVQPDNSKTRPKFWAGFFMIPAHPASVKRLRFPSGLSTLMAGCVPLGSGRERR